MKTYAVYRCLYGEDFIQQSIRSILSHVDKVFVFWTDRVWGDVIHCMYYDRSNGQPKRVVYPKQFDNVLDRVRELNDPKIVLTYDHVKNNLGQFTHFVNDLILPNYPRPDLIMFIEADHVFRKDQIAGAIDEFWDSGLMVASTRQVELWKTPAYRVPERPNRLSVVLWNLTKVKGGGNIPLTGRHANPPPSTPILQRSFVHNFGFCVSSESMYWKHMTAIGMAQAIGDCPPIIEWYEDKWVRWDLHKNNKDLEISQGYAHLIPYAEPYQSSELPECMT